MKFISKEESIKLLGRKKSFWGGNALDATILLYLGGLQKIDDELASAGIDLKNQTCTLIKYPNGYELQPSFVPGKSGGWNIKRFRVAIFPNQLKKWTLENEDAVYQQQSKSVVGRAVIGGLLFGGAGAIVGAISGTKGENKKVNFVDYILTVLLDDDGKDKAIILGFPNDKTKDVRGFFQRNFPNKYVKPKDFEFKKEISSSVNSVADELIKFKKLLDEEVITEDEFQAQKRKLLLEQ